VAEPTPMLGDPGVVEFVVPKCVCGPFSAVISECDWAPPCEKRAVVGPL
jgi:hypothetical protein